MSISGWPAARPVPEARVLGMRAGGPSTPDDVGVKTFDGRHLTTREEILEWLAEIEADRAAGRFVDLSAGTDLSKLR